MNGYIDADCSGSPGACQTEERTPDSGQELHEEQGEVIEGQHEQQQDTSNPIEDDDEKQPIDTDPDDGLNNEELRYWINLGAALCFLGEQDGVDSIPDAFWDRYGPVVDKATALDLARAVSFMPGDSIKTALRGICILSECRYGGYASAGCVPALYVEFLIRYQSLYADRNYVKCSMGLYAVIMEEGGYAFSTIADSLGTGNDKIYAAVKALEENGLLLNAVHINAPGAGRDDIDAAFAFAITPEVIAAKIKYEDLCFRKALKELEELAINGQDSKEGPSGQTEVAGGEPDAEAGDGKGQPTGEAQSPDGGPSSASGACGEGTPHSETQASGSNSTQDQETTAGGASSGAEQQYKTCETEEVDPFKLRDDTLKAFDEAIGILTIALGGKKMDFELWKLRDRLEKGRMTLEDYYTLACPDEGGEAAGEIISFNLVPSFVEYCDTFRRRCDAIIQVKAQAGDRFDTEKGSDPEKAAYWCGKLLHKVVDRKWFLGGLEDEECRYTRICELLEEVKAYIADAGGEGREESGEEEESDADRTKRYEESRTEAFSYLERLIGKIEAALEKTAKGTRFYRKAEETAKFLHTLREDIARAAQPELSDNPDIRILQEVMVAMLGLHMGEALEIWASYKNRRDALKHVVDFLNTKKFTSWVVRTFKTYDMVFQDSQKSQEPSGDSDGQQVPQGQDDECREADEAAAEALRIALEEACALAIESLEAAITSFRTLIGMLRIASDRQVVRKNSTANPVPEAVAYLEGMMERLEKLKAEARNTMSITVRNALRDMAVSLDEKNNAWLEMLVADGRYFQAKQIANSINRRSYHDFCEKQADKALDGGEGNGWDADVLGHYKQIHADDPLGLQSPEGSTISPSERRKIILELWKRGMDPTSIKAWLQYITEQNSREIFADPMGNVSCCKLTPEELSNSFRYLTGCKFSGRALWDYLTRRMGFTRHQCVKEEQIGEAHPQRDAQYRYIDSLKVMCASNGKTHLVSLDSKAVVKIGRFKHDNGLLLCSPDGRVYRVHDHDFVFTWMEIYKDGNCPVGKDRLKEKALVHPIAVYDVLANTCHVSFVLGTENSESMANILIKAIQDKLKECPDIESVVILSDGGGVNSSNSYIWKNELLRVADETNLKLQVAHYPPGCSRHNPVERGVFAPLSRAWRGKSLHNLEVLAALTCATTTKRSKKGSPLKVTVFIDLKQYKTMKQKLEDNDPVISREDFEKKAENRIIHPYTEADGALYKWNYIVLPKGAAAREDG